MSSITISLDEELQKAVKKRADSNFFSVAEQVEDIVRRSMISYKKNGTANSMKVDDSLISIFSREKRGRKKKR